jgi:hypothetical protein
MKEDCETSSGQRNMKTSQAHPHALTTHLLAHPVRFMNFQKMADNHLQDFII